MALRDTEWQCQQAGNLVKTRLPLRYQFRAESDIDALTAQRIHHMLKTVYGAWIWMAGSSSTSARCSAIPLSSAPVRTARIQVTRASDETRALPFPEKRLATSAGLPGWIADCPGSQSSKVRVRWGKISPRRLVKRQFDAGIGERQAIQFDLASHEDCRDTQPAAS